MILQLADFQQEATIPGLFPLMGSVNPNNQVVQERVLAAIEKYEPLFLLKFYDGNREAARLLAQYANLPVDNQTDQEKNRLLATLRVPLSYYVAFYYLRSMTIRSTTIGGVVMQGENGRNINLTNYTQLLWNQMKDINETIYLNILLLPVPKTEIFQYVNDYNL